VPSEHRRAVWLASSGVDLHLLLHKQHYKALRERLRRDGDRVVPEAVRTQIDKDIVRTLRVNIRKDKASLMRKMRRVCLLYAMHNPAIAYSQGFNVMIMSLLILQFTVEEAFWMLDHINTRLFPITWDVRLTGLQADLAAFSYYVGKTFPDFVAFIESLDLKVDQLFPFEAFATLLLEKMPHESAWCVWDRMFAGGASEFFNAMLHIMTYVINKLPMKDVVDTPVPVVAAKKSRFFGRLRPVPEIDLTQVTASSSASRMRRQYDIDAESVVSFFSAEVRRIVDMPRVLALKLRRPISPFALEMRRNRIRMQLLAQQSSQNHDRLGSSSTDSSL
jgi:Rab-GTPase-TBC domain